MIPRRVASFTTSVNELSREFTNHLATVALRGGENIDDVTEEVVKFALQGDNTITMTCLIQLYIMLSLLLSFFLSFLYLPLFLNLSLSLSPSPPLSTIRNILLCVQ